MITVSNNNIYFYYEPVSMHKSFEGLSGLVESAFPGKLLSGCCFVFLNRIKDKIKVLRFDNDGFEIYYKRLEKGKFSIDKNGNTELSRREFLMFFEGIRPKHLDSRFSLKKDK
jgi:transposase